MRSASFQTNQNKCFGYVDIIPRIPSSVNSILEHSFFFGADVTILRQQSKTPCGVTRMVP